VSRADVITIGGWYNNMWQPSSSHWFEFGTNISTNSYLIDPVLKPEEAWNIDTKIDDGKPGTGTVTTFNNPASCPSSSTQATAVYSLNNNAVACTMLMGF
jgi:hypothetical protein